MCRSGTDSLRSYPRSAAFYGGLREVVLRRQRNDGQGVDPVQIAIKPRLLVEVIVLHGKRGFCAVNGALRSKLFGLSVDV